MNLVVRNQCLLARSYAQDGFVPVIDYVVVARDRLGRYWSALRSLALNLVVLCPGKDAAIQRNVERERKSPVAEYWAYLQDIMVRELSGIDLWIDSRNLTAEATVDLTSCITVSKIAWQVPNTNFDEPVTFGFSVNLPISR